MSTSATARLSSPPRATWRAGRSRRRPPDQAPHGRPRSVARFRTGRASPSRPPPTEPFRPRREAWRARAARQRSPTPTARGTGQQLVHSATLISWRLITTPRTSGRRWRSSAVAVTSSRVRSPRRIRIDVARPSLPAIRSFIVRSRSTSTMPTGRRSDTVADSTRWYESRSAVSARIAAATRSTTAASPALSTGSSRALPAASVGAASPGTTRAHRSVAGEPSAAWR